MKWNTIAIYLATNLLLLSYVSVEALPRRFRVSFTPAGKGHPRYTSAGAVRSTQCNQDQVENKSLTAIVPSNEQSLTNKSHPTFLAYIPPNSSSKGVFAIKDEMENYYYEQEVAIPSEGGIVAIPLSQNNPGLEEGKYSWYLRVQCDKYPSMDDPFVGANIRKINSEEPTGLWYEIAEESLNSSEWDDLMIQVNLDFLADETVTYIQ